MTIPWKIVWIFIFLLSIICALTNINYLCIAIGGLAQLVRALAWHARGREFESHILHERQRHQIGAFCCLYGYAKENSRPLKPSFSKEGWVDCIYECACHARGCESHILHKRQRHHLVSFVVCEGVTKRTHDL